MGDISRNRVLFAGGGTAGHLMPAINIALQMTHMDESVEPLFVGKKGGMESAIVAKFGFDIREIDVVGLKRNPMGIVRFLLCWRKGFNQAMKIIKNFEPSVVIGSGGYVSAPVVRAADKRKIPIFLQEQNSLPGLATRILSKRATAIFTAYEHAANFLPREKCRLVGNPLRPDILDAERHSAAREFQLNPSRKILLILGGSSGAQAINRAVLTLINTDCIPPNWQILWQTGSKDFEKIKSLTPKEKFNGQIQPFIFNMPAAYSVADLIISRAGAMALSEIAVWGLPSILIPFPFATGDHQTLNARQFEKSGAAIVIPESEMETKLSLTMEGLLNNESKRDNMAREAKKLARPDASKIIAQIILEKMNEVQTN